MDTQMDISMANNSFSREYVDDISIQRMQENTAREFNKQASSGITSGAMSGTITTISDGIYKVEHLLNREAIGFMIVSQASASSFKAEMISNPTEGTPVDKTKTVFLKFSDYSTGADGIPAPATPGTFRVFLY